MSTDLRCSRNRWLEISKSFSECWKEDDWLSHLDQAFRNALIFEHKDVKFSTPRRKKPKAPDTAHVTRVALPTKKMQLRSKETSYTS